MTRRGMFLRIVVGWLALATTRLLVNLGGGALEEMSWTSLCWIIFSTAFLWVPVSAVILWIDRSKLATRTPPLVATHLAVAILATAIEPFWLVQVLATVGKAQPYLGTLISRLDINLLIYSVVVAADVAWMRFQALKVRELAAARLEQTLVDIQLHALAIQLQPHFLFNALGFVAETAHDDLEAARRTLRLLRGLVEQAFELETRVEVTVAEEVSFLRAYAEIQRSRFGDRFSLTMNVDPEALEGGIPPLLLQPLVENASRHGFASRGSGGHIEVTVRRTRSDILSIVVADDGVGLSGQIKEGQGLSVTRRRIGRLYGPNAHLTLARAADGRTESRLRLPFRAPVLDEPEGDDPSIGGVEPLEERTTSLDKLVARIPFAGRVAAIWLGLLALLITGTYAGVALHVFWPEALPGLQALFLEEMVGVPFWIALTVIAVVAARRLSGRWAIPLHVLLAAIVALSHAALGEIVAERVFHAKPSMDPRFAHWATWDALVYAAIVLIARAHELGAWMRAKVREEVTLSEQVLRASGRLGRLRETQSVLLASLDEVIASPTMETLDRAVVEFADFLRVDVMAGVSE